MSLKDRIARIESRFEGVCPTCGQLRPGADQTEVMRERAKELFERALARLGSEAAAREWIAHYPELSQYVS